MGKFSRIHSPVPLVEEVKARSWSPVIFAIYTVFYVDRICHPKLLRRLLNVVLISKALVIIVFHVLTLSGLATLTGRGLEILRHFTMIKDYFDSNINLKISKLQPVSVARPDSVK